MPPRSRQRVPSHAEALASALATLELGQVDDAAKRVALEYASQIDADPEKLTKIGHMYLAALNALGLTPAARAALAKGGAADSVPAGADELSRLRAQRAR